MGADGSMSDRRDRKNRWTKFVPYLFSVWQHDASSHCVQSHGVGFFVHPTLVHILNVRLGI
jgi:hypothetical protein